MSNDARCLRCHKCMELRYVYTLQGICPLCYDCFVDVKDAILSCAPHMATLQEENKRLQLIKQRYDKLSMALKEMLNENQ